MKFINVCGYGNTGCTSQVDVLCDYEGVFGVLSPLQQTHHGKTAYHEIGVLKWLHSIGGVVIARLNGAKELPSKKELINSLKGNQPGEGIELNFGANLHLEMRQSLNAHYGNTYADLVDETFEGFPENLNNVELNVLIGLAREATSTWLMGLKSIVEANPNLLFRDGEKVEVLGLKNDPPGAFPLLASFIPEGITSAILRDPRDTTYDFNRHYKLGHTDQTVKNHCIHYNAQLNSARKQIETYFELIKEHYFVHEFEHLVQDEEYRNKYVEKMIGKRTKLRHYFTPENSAKNIGHYTNMTQEHIDYVEENCLRNYLDYKEFLDKKGLLLQK